VSLNKEADRTLFAIISQKKQTHIKPWVNVRAASQM